LDDIATITDLNLASIVWLSLPNIVDAGASRSAFALFFLRCHTGGAVETRPSTTQSPVPVPTYSLAPYEQRLAAAQSVKVMTAVLGLELGSTLKQAHAKLDKLSDPKHPPKEETEGSEGKVLWQMADTDYY
jgi:hypothetical protein